MVPDSLTHRVMFGNASSNDDFIGLVQRDAQRVRFSALGWTVTRFSADSWHEGVGKAARPRLRRSRRETSDRSE
jgi:hypothetical protein